MEFKAISIMCLIIIIMTNYLKEDVNNMEIDGNHDLNVELNKTEPNIKKQSRTSVFMKHIKITLTNKEHNLLCTTEILIEDFMFYEEPITYILLDEQGVVCFGSKILQEFMIFNETRKLTQRYLDIVNLQQFTKKASSINVAFPKLEITRKNTSKLSISCGYTNKPKVFVLTNNLLHPFFLKFVEQFTLFEPCYCFVNSNNRDVVFMEKFNCLGESLKFANQTILFTDWDLIFHDEEVMINLLRFLASSKFDWFLPKDPHIIGTSNLNGPVKYISSTYNIGMMGVNMRSLEKIEKLSRIMHFDPDFNQPFKDQGVFYKLCDVLNFKLILLSCDAFNGYKEYKDPRFEQCSGRYVEHPWLFKEKILKLNLPSPIVNGQKNLI